MSATIAAIQEEIISEFSLLAEDTELTLHHLMDQGRTLLPFPEESKKDKHLVKGCQSKVWLLSSCKEARMCYRATSDAAITRGLVSLLLRIFSGQPAAAILRSELFFPARIHMDRFIGTQRSGGFSLMFSQIKQHALAQYKQIPS